MEQVRSSFGTKAFGQLVEFAVPKIHNIEQRLTPQKKAQQNHVFTCLYINVVLKTA